MEFKTIQIDKVLANFSQPREQFEKEKIQELAESILSNGLINKPTVRKWKDKYMLVTGERRFMACKLLGWKTIPVEIKEYKNDFRYMVESSIENYQRVDITSSEKEKDIFNVWKQGLKDGEIKTYVDFSKYLGLNPSTIQQIIEAKQDREKLKLGGKIATRDISDTKNLKDEDRIKLLKKLEKGELKQVEVRDYARVIKQSTPEVKKALLDDKISVEQASNLSKIHSPKAREEALRETKQHQHIANIIPELKKNANPELTDALKKKFMSAQRTIFEYLFKALKGIVYAEKDLKKANEMLIQLMSKQFEYALNKKDLAVSLSQMKRISDTLNQFGITEERFNGLKEYFIERIENKIEEEND